LAKLSLNNYIPKTHENPNVYWLLTGRTPKSPMFMRGSTGFRLRHPRRALTPPPPVPVLESVPGQTLPPFPRIRLPSGPSQCFPALSKRLPTCLGPSRIRPFAPVTKSNQE
jgi:hypothetical protein